MHETSTLPRLPLGDFNKIENTIGQAPAKHDNHLATDTLRDIRLTWEIQDQWRHTHPNKTQYTYQYQKNGGSRLSRLDRIYFARRHTPTIFKWKAELSTVPTDHWLVSLKIHP